MDNYFYDAYVVDRSNGNEVCVLALGSRTEAVRCKRLFEEFDCDAYIVKYFYNHGKKVEI